MNKEYRVNAFCKDQGWLFEDLKRTLAVAGAHISEDPDRRADAWICIRSREWKLIPDLRRAVVQIHDVRLRPKPTKLNAAGCVQFTHPFQEALWRAKGFKGHSEVTPIGSRACIAPVSTKPARPTIGFFCRENKAMTKGSPLFRQAVMLARQVADFDVLLIGSRLKHIADIGRYEKRAAGPTDYARIDALVCTSESPCVPLSVYEACAAGLPVISTARQFPGNSWPMVVLADSAESLASSIVRVVTTRPRYPGHMAYTLESWAAKTVQIARGLCNSNDNGSEIRCEAQETSLIPTA